VLVFSGRSEVGTVGAGCGDAVGADDGAVEVEVGVSDGNGTFQSGGHVKPLVVRNLILADLFPSA
jgi:hypothetical protein